MPGKLTRIHVIELRHHQAIGKEYCVEEKRLSHHQNQGQDGALSVVYQHVAEDFAPGCVITHAQTKLVTLGARKSALLLCDIGFDRADHRIGLFFSPTQHQPPRTLRYRESKVKHAESEYSSHRKRE